MIRKGRNSYTVTIVAYQNHGEEWGKITLGMWNCILRNHICHRFAALNTVPFWNSFITFPFSRFSLARTNRCTEFSSWSKSVCSGPISLKTLLTVGLSPICDFAFQVVISLQILKLKFRNKISCLQWVPQRPPTNKIPPIYSFDIRNNISEDQICHML
jgi:hypothetical protein